VNYFRGNPRPDSDPEARVAERRAVPSDMLEQTDLIIQDLTPLAFPDPARSPDATMKDLTP
jgi:hypothetical protein